MMGGALQTVFGKKKSLGVVFFFLFVLEGFWLRFLMDVDSFSLIKFS